MVKLDILIHSLRMCSSGDSNCCGECHCHDMEDCSLELMREAADALASNEEDYDDKPDDWDREMGFDPYEGCYTYDC